MNKVIPFLLIGLIQASFVPLNREDAFLLVWKEVVEITETEFYRKDMKETDWKSQKAESFSYIEKCQNTEEAVGIINDLLSSLKSSHCEYLPAGSKRYFELLSIFRGRQLWPEIEARFQDIEAEKSYRKFLKSIEDSVRLYGTVGYVKMECYAHDEYQQELVQLLSTGKLKDAEALILDLRCGWGGADPAYLSLFSEKIPDVQITYRNGRQRRLLNSKWLNNHSDFRWKKPVCLLVDRGTRSGKEVFAWAFKKYKIGKVLGEKTAGAVIAGKAFFLSDDSLVYLPVASLTVDGEILEGKPIVPDITSDTPLKRALKLFGQDD